MELACLGTDRHHVVGCCLVCDVVELGPSDLKMVAPSSHLVTCDSKQHRVQPKAGCFSGRLRAFETAKPLGRVGVKCRRAGGCAFSLPLRMNHERHPTEPTGTMWCARLEVVAPSDA